MQSLQFGPLVIIIAVLSIKAVAVPTRISDYERSYAIYHSIDFTNEERPTFSIFEKALAGYNVLTEKDEVKKPILTIIDFTKSANEKRLWVIDLQRKKLLYHCLTAHGKNSGEIFANSFSNVPNSNKSSLGFFVTGSTYLGKHGISLKLKGLERHINDKAEARAIVMHGADYVSEEHIQKYGRLGRSFGCPAIPMSLHKQIIETIADGACLFIYHSSRDYHQETALAK